MECGCCGDHMTGLGRPNVEDVRSALNVIIDPCSVAAGVPGGLGDMGLIRYVEVKSDVLTVHIAITSQGCMMGPSFVASAREVLTKIPGVGQVDVILSDWAEWSEDAMSTDYRDRLAQARMQQRRRLTLVAVNHGELGSEPNDGAGAA